MSHFGDVRTLNFLYTENFLSTFAVSDTLMATHPLFPALNSGLHSVALEIEK